MLCTRIKRSIEALWQTLLLSYYHNFIYIHALVPISLPKCSALNLHSNGLFYLALHVFVNELQVGINLI